MGGTKTVVAIGEPDGTVLEEHRFPTSDGPGTFGVAVDWLRQRGEPDSIGVAAFGPVSVDPERSDFGTMLATPKAGWAGFSIRDELAAAFPSARFALDTDVNAAALAEADGLRDLAYITIGTGIGAGVLSGGRLIHGVVHPEFGHLRVPKMAGDEFEGVCPFHGDCLEGLASGPAFAKRWGREAKDVDPQHCAWELEAAYLAHGVLALLAIVCPARVVIGGGVSQAEGFHDNVEKKLGELANGYYPALEATPYIVPPQHGQQAGIRGALLLAAGEA